MKKTLLALLSISLMAGLALAELPMRAPAGPSEIPVLDQRTEGFEYTQTPDYSMIYGLSSGFNAEFADDIPAEYEGYNIWSVTVWVGQWWAGPSGPWVDPTGLRLNFYHDFCPPELDPFRTEEWTWAELDPVLVSGGSSQRVFRITVNMTPGPLIEAGMSLGVTPLIDWGHAEPFTGVCATPMYVSYGACPAYLDGDNWGYTRWTAIDFFTQIPQDLGYILEGGTSTGSPAPPVAATTFRAHPNPFNPRSTLTCELATAGPVTLSILDLSGRRVATLYEGRREAGELRLDWDGRDDAGHSLPTGVYLARLDTAVESQGIKLLLLK
jgi:hypothetical protein